MYVYGCLRHRTENFHSIYVVGSRICLSHVVKYARSIRRLSKNTEIYVSGRLFSLTFLLQSVVGYEDFINLGEDVRLLC